MGGCVGLRLNRVSWSYVLAFGGTSLQNLHSPFSIWLAYGHRGSDPQATSCYHSTNTLNTYSCIPDL